MTTRLPPATTPAPPGCGAGLTRTHVEAVRYALNHASRSGIRHAVTRIHPDPDGEWAEFGWKYAWVRTGTENR